MPILHSVNKSPFAQKTLQQCLQVIGDQHALILIEDGVYAALKDSPTSSTLEQKHARGVKIYALESDIKMRGLSNLISTISLINMTDFVDLCCQHTSVQSWY